LLSNSHELEALVSESARRPSLRQLSPASQEDVFPAAGTSWPVAFGSELLGLARSARGLFQRTLRFDHQRLKTVDHLIADRATVRLDSSQHGIVTFAWLIPHDLFESRISE
jgi:hypothetical protein